MMSSESTTAIRLPVILIVHKIKKLKYTCLTFDSDIHKSKYKKTQIFKNTVFEHELQKSGFERLQYRRIKRG